VAQKSRLTTRRNPTSRSARECASDGNGRELETAESAPMRFWHRPRAVRRKIRMRGSAARTSRISGDSVPSTCCKPYPGSPQALGSPGRPVRQASGGPQESPRSESAMPQVGSARLYDLRLSYATEAARGGASSSCQWNFSVTSRYRQRFVTRSSQRSSTTARRPLA
jgi:hypothetical protein